MMGNIILAISISLDGSIAGPGDEGERLHQWVFGGKPDGRLPPGHYPQAVADADILAELFATTGAVVMGRRTFDLHEGPWGENPPFHVPCFVLTHRKREKLIKGGGTTFTFVTEGIASMLAQAQDVSGEKQVYVLGGASLARQCIQAGLLDEIQLHLVPVLLGEGLRLFDHLGNAPLELEAPEVVCSPFVTHLRFRVRKREGASQDRLEESVSPVLSLCFPPTRDLGNEQDKENPRMSENHSSSPASSFSGDAPGPLVVCAANPRYFTVAADSATQRSAVYLTGSHIWNTFQDGLGPGLGCSEAPERNDYSAYLAFLKAHGHNFIRLWRWEQFKSQAATANFHLCMTPQPWPRTGPGLAIDGKPKFDLSRFDPRYFDRLRDRVTAAGNEGIYVSVMLFDGFGLHLSQAPDQVEGHPFFAANNVNGIALTSINDSQVLPLDPAVQALQEAYLRKVIETVADLPNVLYEVANESVGGGQVDQRFADVLGLSQIPSWGDSTAWQYGVIEFVKQYEQQMGYPQHPIGMTMQFPVSDQSSVNDVLYTSPADWISPGDEEIFVAGEYPDEAERPASGWLTNPPENVGSKIVLTDTDHYAAGRGDALWVWKSFLRGHHPILMDFGIINVSSPLDPALGVPAFESFEPARYAMGDTLRFASRVRLIEMAPRSNLSSTGYALANPGEEYLVLQPNEAADPFTVMVEAGTYAVEWFDITSRQTEAESEIAVGRAETTLFTPTERATGPMVLYLKRRTP